MKNIIFILFISATFINNYHASCSTNSDLLSNEDGDINSTKNISGEMSEKYYSKNHDLSIRIDTVIYPEIKSTIFKSFISLESKDYAKTFNEQLKFIYEKIERYLWWRYRVVGSDIYYQNCKDTFFEVKVEITYFSDSRLSLNVVEHRNSCNFSSDLTTFFNYILDNGTPIPVNFMDLFIIDIDSLNFCNKTGELHYGDLNEKFEDPDAYCRGVNFGILSKNNISFSFVDDGIAILYTKESYLYREGRRYETDGRIIKFKEMEPYLNKIYLE